VAVLGTQGAASVAAGAAHQIALQTWWLFSFFAVIVGLFCFIVGLFRL
jgi:hypothetical protein